MPVFSDKAVKVESHAKTELNGNAAPCVPDPLERPETGIAASQKGWFLPIKRQEFG